MWNEQVWMKILKNMVRKMVLLMLVGCMLRLCALRIWFHFVSRWRFLKQVPCRHLYFLQRRAPAWTVLRTILPHYMLVVRSNGVTVLSNLGRDRFHAPLLVNIYNVLLIKYEVSVFDCMYKGLTLTFTGIHSLC